MDYENLYKKYKAKYLALKNNQFDYNQNGGGSKINLYLFKAEWCGHCKRFMPTWDKLQKVEQFKNKYNFITYDSDKNRDKIDEWGIEGFPTIMMEHNGKAMPYDGPRDEPTMIEMLQNLQD